MAFDALAMQRRALITPERMALADQRAIDAGTPRSILIERAARAVLRVLRSRYLRRPTTVLCGPGQNGEDGLLLAALLAEAEWPLTVVMSDDTDETRAPVLNSLSPYLRPSGTFAPAEGALVVDALFGARASCQSQFGVANQTQILAREGCLNSAFNLSKPLAHFNNGCLVIFAQTGLFEIVLHDDFGIKRLIQIRRSKNRTVQRIL